MSCSRFSHSCGDLTQNTSHIAIVRQALLRCGGGPVIIRDFLSIQLAFDFNGYNSVSDLVGANEYHDGAVVATRCRQLQCESRRERTKIRLPNHFLS